MKYKFVLFFKLIASRAFSQFPQRKAIIGIKVFDTIVRIISILKAKEFHKWQGILVLKEGSIKEMLFILILFTYTAHSQAPYEKLVPGKMPVGFQTFYLFDSRRPAIEEQKVKDKGRAMQINVWYPSQHCKGLIMNFRDYVALIAKEYDPGGQDSIKALADYFDWTIKDGKAGKELIDFKKNGVAMKAIKNAPGLAEKFPVVLLMHGRAADFAFLGEFLAGSGYVAIHTPYKGYLQAELDLNLTGMDTQVADYEFAISSLKAKINGDFENIAVLGMSFGGQSAIAYTFNNLTRAVISYDGGIGSEFGAQLLTNTKAYSLQKIEVPLLHLFNPRDEYTSLTAIKAYRYCDRTLVGMKNMEHVHFSAWGCLDKFIPGAIAAVGPGLSYEALLQQTIDFLNLHQKNKKIRGADWCKTARVSLEYIQKN